MKKIVIIAMMVGFFTELNAKGSELTNNDYKVNFTVAFDNDDIGQVIDTVKCDPFCHGGRLSIPKQAKTITVNYNGDIIIDHQKIDWTKSARLVMDLDHNWSVVPIN